METLDLGEIATMSAVWSNAAGEFKDPDTITLTIELPDGSTMVKHKADCTRDSIGHWHYDETATLEGAWEYEFDGQGVDVTAKQGGVFLVGVDVYDGPFEPWCTWDEVADMPQFADAATQAILDGIDGIERAELIDAASEVLWNLSGRIYPGYKVVRRSLCAWCPTCGWWGWRGGGYAGWCGCAPYNRIALRGRYPVVAIREVLVEGAAVARDVYRLEANRYLVRLDGQHWPTGANLTDPTAFQIRYVLGAPVPMGGRRAARALVADDVGRYVLACQGVPDRVTSIAREGVTFTLKDPAAMIDKGASGIVTVDRWLASLREGRRAPAGIFDPARAGATRRI